MQSPFWAANGFAVSQEIPRILRNPKFHYRTHKRPPHVSIQGQSIYPHPTSRRSILILSTHLCLGLANVSSPPVFPPRPYTPPSPHPYAPRAQNVKLHVVILQYNTSTRLGICDQSLREPRRPKILTEKYTSWDLLLFKIMGILSSVLPRRNYTESAVYLAAIWSNQLER